MAQRKITTGGIEDNAITASKIAAGAVEQSDINSSVVLGAQGMVHGFITDGVTGTLTWKNDVTSIQDGDGNDLYDSVIVGTDDMSFSVDANGHLIMTIS